MSEITANYGLYITDDSSEKFLNWRTKMNGTEDSNMIKIDTALGEKANHSHSITVTLLANNWSGIESPYTQEITIENLTQNQNGFFWLAHSATQDQRNMAREAMLAIIGQTDGKLVIAADGELPDIDIPITIILLD